MARTLPSSNWLTRQPFITPKSKALKLRGVSLRVVNLNTLPTLRRPQVRGALDPLRWGVIHLELGHHEWVEIDATGMWYHRINPETGHVTSAPVTARPVTVIADAIPAEPEAPHGVVVQYMTPAGEIQKLVMDRAMAHSQRFAIELANAGVQIDPRHATVLARYLARALPPRRVVTFIRTGWHESPHPVFVLGNEVIGAAAESTLFRGVSMAHVTSAGTLRDWLRHVARPACRAGVRWWRLAVMAGFAAPLLKVADQGSFAIHALGVSSVGKSLGLRIAGSLFGGREFLSSWNTTTAAVEALAARATDLPLLLDEIAEADAHTVGRIIYGIANEFGRARLRPDATARPRMRWRTIALSTGEHSVESRVAGTRERLAGGQAVRMIEILVDTHQQSAGMTRRVPLAEIRRLETALRRFHGTAGPVFIKRLIEEGYGTPNSIAARRFRKKVDRFAGVLIGNDKDPRRQRAGRAFALLRAAGDLALKWQLLPREAAPAETIARAWRTWKKHNKSATDDARSAARRLVEIIDRNIDVRISHIDSNSRRERWGWYEAAGDDMTVFVLSTTLSAALRGFSTHAFLVRAVDCGALMRRGEGRNLQVKVAGVKGNPRAYQFSLSALRRWSGE